MASLMGPEEDMQHVLSVSPCKNCQAHADEPKDWVWGRCTTPTRDNAVLIAQAPTMRAALDRIAAIIEAVDNRCMACDGPVTPTLQEMTQEEISEIYALASRTHAQTSAYQPGESK